MEELQIEAIKVWLKTALSKVPTYTGTARGTFKPVGRIVGKQIRRGQVRGRSDPRKKKSTTWGGITYSTTGPPAGEQYGDASISKRKYRDGITLAFSFSQSLPYALWNEATPGPPGFIYASPHPWHALSAAKEAYEKFLNKNLKAPEYKKFRKVKIITD
jgi:hypothetical protein